MSDNGAKALPDSGARQQFSGGAVREPSTGKGRYDLVPAYPMRRLAQHYENGAVKYADRNWEKGIPLGRFLDSAERHIGMLKDNDRTEDHLAAVLWNIAGYIWTEREIVEGRLPKTLWNVPWSDSLSRGAMVSEKVSNPFDVNIEVRGR